MAVFSPLIWKKMREFVPSPHKKFFWSKSVKIFHHIFDITHNQGHAPARMLCLISVCENTMFSLSLCQILAITMHCYSQFWSLSQLVYFERGVSVVVHWKNILLRKFNHDLMLFMRFTLSCTQFHSHQQYEIDAQKSIIYKQSSKSMLIL